MRKKAIEITKTWNKDLTSGDKLEGRYIKKEVYESEFLDGKLIEKYIIDTPEGEKMGVYGTSSLFNQFQQIPEGSYVWIEYKGEQTSSKGRKVKVYEVDYDDEYQA